MNRTAVLDWEAFRAYYFTTKRCFAKEYDDRWCFYSYEGPIVVKCEKMKLDDAQDQLLFESEFHARSNVIAVLDFEEDIVEEYPDVDEYPQIDDNYGF